MDQSAPHRLFDSTLPDALPGPVPAGEIYRRLSFPDRGQGGTPRPYTVINMVSTADGKVVVGEPGTTGMIGGSTDHLLMGRLMMATDGELFGAQLIRDDNPRHPRLSDAEQEERSQRGLRPQPFWVIVTTRASFRPLPRALEAGKDNIAIFAGSQIEPEHARHLEPLAQLYVGDSPGVDFSWMGRVLYEEIGLRRLNCLGGPSLNGSLIAAGAADELFLTLAPKLKSGRGLPTAVEGDPFPADAMPRMELRSLYAHDGELYLRYRLPASRA
ncbi:MAG TPA: dihydrofolate reductase family protein [Chloroflexota bacterium]|nr:dihydrofolate reductase family protein [Chloroflexota bacterium]